MYKIIAAINSMIENSHLINNVFRSETGELFFLYNGAFCWSMHSKQSGDYFLHYYPGEKSPQQLASIGIEEWGDHIDYVTYSTSEIKTKEASESFSELYTILQNKLYNIDAVLDDIINTTA